MFVVLNMAEFPLNIPLSIDIQTVDKTAFTMFSADRFTNVQPVGCGTGGLVFSATDTVLDRRVAIKRLSLSSVHTCRQRFLREVRIMRKLDHENVVTIYDFFHSPPPLEDDAAATDAADIPSLSPSFIYIVQELLDTDLGAVIHSGQMTPSHCRLFAYQLLRGLKYIHSANVLHRDLKPSNILVNCRDLMLKIGDFGVARVVDPAFNHQVRPKF